MREEPSLTAPDPKTRPGTAVAEMFSAIAATYDLLNHVLSLNMDRHWRNVAVKELAASPSDLVLDLCTGTGDLAFTLVRRSGARAVGADFSRPMMDIASRKARRTGLSLPLAQADALALPFRSGGFDAVMVAFGVRNFEDLDGGLREMARVTKLGGKLAVLEFSSPQHSLFGAVYRVYFTRVLPLVGRLVSGRGGAYAYLPATVADFPGPPAFASRLRQAGFEVKAQRPLTGGIATLHLCQRTGAVPVPRLSGTGAS